MKTTLKLLTALLMLLSVTNCSKSPNDLAEEVKIDMQKIFNSDPDIKPHQLTVTGVTVVKESENKYNGIAVVSKNGKPYSASVSITYDGDNLLWELEPGFMLQFEDFSNIFDDQDESDSEESKITIIGKWTDKDKPTSYWIFDDNGSGQRNAPDHRTFTWESVSDGELLINLEATDEFPDQSLTYYYEAKGNKMSIWPEGFEEYKTILRR